MSLIRLARDLWRATLPVPPRPVAWLLVAWVVVVAIVGLTPFSPLALDRADATLARGRPDQAAARYDAAARYALTESTRHTALERSAVVWGGELALPSEARVRVEQLVTETDEAARRAKLLEWSADLLLAERRPAEAAARYQWAAETLPGTRAAGERLQLAARAYRESGRLGEAATLWRRVVRDHPAQRSVALVGLAGLALGEGDAHEALRLYERATRSTDGHLAAVARLGAATCLERLGDLDSAIAELDQVDLPAPVRVQRVQGLKIRQSAGAL